LIRAALDTRGLRIVGNLTTHDLTWQEITPITKRRARRAARPQRLRLIARLTPLVMVANRG